MARQIGLLVFMLFMANGDALVQGQEPAKPAGNGGQVAHLDFLGDPLPADAISRLGSSRLRHGHTARDVVFSPDGTKLASAGHDHSVRLWEAATGKELRKFTIEGERDNPYSSFRWFHCLAFSPDGKILASGFYADGWIVNNICLWEAASGKLLHRFEGPKGGVLALAFSPSGGTLAAAGADHSIGFWDPSTGQQQRTWIAHEGAVRSVVFRPDGNVLASAGDDQTIRLWDATNNKELRKLSGHQAEVESVCFSSDGKTLASGSRDKTVRLWDPDTGAERAVWSGHTDSVLRVAFAPDGKTVASASKDKTIGLWNVASGKKMRSLEGHSLEVPCLSFAPDGKTLASAGLDRQIYLWDTRTGNRLLPQPGHGEVAVALEFLQGGSTLMSFGRDDTIRWWNWRTGKQDQIVPWHTVLPSAVSFDPMGDLVAVGSPEGSVRLMSMTSGKELGRLQDEKRPIQSVAFSPNGKILATSTGTTALVWDVAARKVSKRLAEQAGGHQFLLFASNSKLLFAGDTESRLWDVEKDRLIRTLPLSFNSLKSAAFSPDGRMIACGGAYGQVELWDVEIGEKVRAFSGLAGYVRVVFSPDGRLVAGGAWRGVKVWETATGYERRVFHEFEGDAFALAFSPDGRALAAGVGDDTILIWDMAGKVPALDGKAAAALDQQGKGLAAADGQLVHQAIWGLVAQPDTAVPYLRTLFKSAAVTGNQALAGLIKDLDNDVFDVREKASEELQKLGSIAEPALRKVLTDGSSPEAKERARDLLQKLAKAPPSPEKLRALRAIETLEYIGTPEAHRLLRELADGTSASQIIREATASLERLRRRTEVRGQEGR